MKSKTKLISAAVLASFLLVNFAFAQVTPTGTTINKALLDTAATKAGCIDLKNKLQSESGSLLKAVWEEESTFESPDGPVALPGQCFITSGDTESATDGITALPGFVQTAGSQDLQNRIKAGASISAGEFNIAYWQDQADKNDASKFSSLVGWALNLVLSVVNIALLWMAALAGNIFTTAVNWILNGNTVPAVVLTGWTIVRDISNLFFILILIVIGLAAILRIESYDYRHLLVETVMMALLVNFSLVIATTLISFVDVLVSIFATRHGEIWSFVYWYVNFGDLTSGTLPNGWMAGLFQGITKIIFTFVAMTTFLALAGMFVIRIVGIYILLIFSPLAYVLHVLPATKHYAEDWWKNFIKYLIWPPVALFMLQLAMLVIKDPGVTGGARGNQTFLFIILMAFMWGAVVFAQHAGMVGSAAVVKGAQNVGRGAAKIGWGVTDRKLASWTGKGGVRGAFSYLSFGAWKKGREAALHHKEEEAYTVAAGKRANQYNRIFGSKEPGDFERLAQYQRVAQEKKRFENVTDKDELTAAAVHAHREGEYDKFMGVWSKLAAQGDMNEVPLAMGKAAGAESIQEIVREIVTKSKNKVYTRLAADVTKVAEGQGDFIFAGAFERDPTTGEYGDRKPDKRREYVNTQRAKNSDQSNVRNLNRRGLGFIEKVEKVNGQDVWYIDRIDDDGIDYASRLKDIGGWRNNGNKNAKANVAISGSRKWLDANPEAWAAAASEYAELEMDSNPERLIALQKTVAAPNIDKNYHTEKTVNRDQAKEFFEVIRPEIRVKYETGDKDTVRDYDVLYKYYKNGPTAPTPTPPPTPGGGGGGGAGGAGPAPRPVGSGRTAAAAAAAGSATPTPPPTP